ncbi:MAG: GrpB family protein [Niastella sp.]|nr:GrpB family protein [Niastella sp.]
MPIIKVVDYSPTWPIAFEELNNLYKEKLHGLYKAIEHVGSTSVPGLAAKPVLDIDIVVEATADLTAIIQGLSSLGYYHIGDRGIPGREAFKRLDDSVPYASGKKNWMEHHLYVCREGSASLQNHLTLRNYLRSNPSAMNEYATLKRKLAQAHPTNMNDYMEGKSAFIASILIREGMTDTEVAAIIQQNKASR